ncbi:MAG: acylneuraminate cytidylyltransferase [Bacteriovoracaceae bacterium]|nr:acylneuraminate cytidylyltransferase [Bacteriovoracaceae bacterium]
MKKAGQKIVIIIQARMTSSRLPGKILKEVLGKSLLEYEIERLQEIPSKPEIWIATTTNQTDEPTVELAEKLKIKFFRGSEDDVLARYYFCAKEAKADAIVRITADCPLIDPEIVSEVIETYKKSDADYVSNVVERTYPRGLDAEIFSFKALEESFHEAKSQSEREHVTPFIRENANRYRSQNVKCASGNYAAHRWTVDTKEDFDLIKHLLEALYPNNPKFRMQHALQLLVTHPDWSKINADVAQKKE